jgi:hypothetical protein
MSKPAGKCVFCDRQGNLTHGHIWPEWIGESIEFETTSHFQITGNLEVFTPTRIPPRVERRSKQGHGTARKPRNTCGDCNSGWMSQIESSAKPFALPIMQGKTPLLDTIGQFFVASLLCLIAMRNEFGAFPYMIAVPQSDRDWLRTHRYPPWHWKIWVARYDGPKDQHWAYHLPMHLDSSRTSETGPDKVNTQTTTMVIGQICAHVFSSTTLDDSNFGYRGIRLCRIWPPSNYYINWANVAAHGDVILLSLAEALSRDIPFPDMVPTE